MASTLERAARAVWDEIARQNGENTSGYAGTNAGRPDYVEGFIDSVALVRAVLMAVREQWLEVYHASEGTTLPTYEQAEGFPDMIDAILNEKDTTND